MIPMTDSETLLVVGARVGGACGNNRRTAVLTPTSHCCWIEKDDTIASAALRRNSVFVEEEVSFTGDIAPASTNRLNKSDSCIQQ